MSLRLIEGQPRGNAHEAPVQKLEIVTKTVGEFLGYAGGILFEIPQLKEAATKKAIGMPTPPSFFSEQERDEAAVEFQTKDDKDASITHYLVRGTPDFLSVLSQQGEARNRLVIDLKSRTRQKGQQYTDEVTFEKYKMSEGVLSEYEVKKDGEAMESGLSLLLDLKRQNNVTSFYPYENSEKTSQKRMRRRSGVINLVATAATITLRPFH